MRGSDQSDEYAQHREEHCDVGGSEEIGDDAGGLMAPEQAVACRLEGHHENDQQGDQGLLHQ